MGRRPILIVDDDASTREVLRLAATTWGHRVCEAQSGGDALRLFDELRPAVVITAVVMAQLNGLELLRLIKDRNPSAAVILITAYGAINDAVTAMKLGATDYLTKPIDFAKLKSLIEGSIAALEAAEAGGETSADSDGSSAFQFRQPPPGISPSKSVSAEVAPPLHRTSPTPRRPVPRSRLDSSPGDVSGESSLERG